jgi:hypothetical protein
LSKTLKGRDHVGDIGVDSMIILKIDLKERRQDVNLMNLAEDRVPRRNVV